MIGLTYYEEKGEIKFLKEVIKEKASVAEVAHFIFFLEDNILAFEYNSKSSRSPSLANYINTKTRQEYFIRFKMLLNKNKKNRLKSINKIKSLKFEASSKLILSDKAGKTAVFTAFDSALALTNQDSDVEQWITIEVKPRRITKKTKNPYYDADEIKKTIDDLERNCNDTEKLFKLDLVGFNELNEKIIMNYTNDAIIEKIIIDSDKTESKYFYEEIIEAYLKIYKIYIK